jgi:cell wall-associated NlpC family hydrolase
VIAIVGSAVAAAMTAPLAQADRIAEKRAEASQVLAEIRQSNAHLEQVEQKYELAAIRLHSTQVAIRLNTARLTVARANLKSARHDLRTSLISAYKAGKPDVLQAVLSAGSLSNMLAEVDLVQRANRYNADVVTRVRVYRTEVARRQRALSHERTRRRAIVKQQADKRDEYRRLIRQQQQIYAGITVEIHHLIAEQIAAERAAALARERAAQAALAAARAAQTVSSGVGGVAVGDVGASSGAASVSQTSQAAAPTPVPEVATSSSTATAPTTQAAPVPVAPPASGVGAQAASIALGEQGVPYVYGGESPGGFDCSGLVAWAYGQVGISLPHSSYALWSVGTHVSESELAPGDLVFFDGLGHVGMYIGGGAFVHAPHTGTVVQVTSLSGYYASSYVGAVRVTG